MPASGAKEVGGADGAEEAVPTTPRPRLGPALLPGSLWLGTGGGAGRAPTPRRPELLRPRHQALPDSGPRSPGGGGHQGGGIPAGIPTPPPQFVHFLPWLQISTISLSGHLRPLPLPGPELTLAGDRTVLVLPAPSWEPGWPSVKHPDSRPWDARRGSEPELGRAWGPSRAV